MRCWRGWGWRCCRILAPGRPSAALVQELLPAWQPVEVFADRLYVIRPYAPRVSRAVETFSRYLKATFSEPRPAPAPAPR